MTNREILFDSIVATITLGRESHMNINKLSRLKKLYTSIKRIYNRSNQLSQFMAATKDSILNNKSQPSFDGFPQVKVFTEFYSLFNKIINPSRSQVIKNSLGPYNFLKKIVIKYDKIVDFKNSISTIIPNDIIVRHYNKPSIQYEQKILMSLYLINYANEVLSRLILPKDSYIINIMYIKARGIVDATGSTQLFVTGTSEGTEDALTTLRHEVREETCLDFDPQDVTLLKKGHSRTNTIRWYSCPIQKMRVINHIKNRDSPINRISQNKVICIIWGTKEQVTQKLKEISVTDSQNEDKIAGLVAISFEDVKKIANIIDKSRYNYLTHFVWDTRNQQHSYAFTGRVLPD